MKIRMERAEAIVWAIFNAGYGAFYAVFGWENRIIVLLAGMGLGIGWGLLAIAFWEIEKPKHRCDAPRS